MPIHQVFVRTYRTTTLLGFSTVASHLVDNGAQLCTVLTNKLGLAWLLPCLGIQLLFTPTLFWQIRESMYQSLGLMSTSVAAFYACGAGQGLWGPGLMDHVEYMDHQHLRMLLRHLMLSFTRICPPQHRYAPIPCSVPFVCIFSITSSNTLKRLNTICWQSLDFPMLRCHWSQ